MRHDYKGKTDKRVFCPKCKNPMLDLREPDHSKTIKILTFCQCPENIKIMGK